jgi:GNAT superfamily N-acetyltransferase
MAEDLIIRPAGLSDCDPLTALMLRSSAYDGRYRRMIENYPVTPAMVDRNEVWVVERGGSAVGFYRLDFANADLDLMFVDDAAQGAGIGRMIFRHMVEIAAARGLEELQIVAHPPAADFYRRMGAVDVSISKAKHANGWDRPILRLAISK